MPLETSFERVIIISVSEIKIRRGELRGHIADQGAKVMLPLFAVMLFSLYILAAYKLTVWEPITFLLLSIVSVVACFIFGMSISNQVEVEGLRKLLIGIVAYIPWLFGTFLFLYKGLWPLTFLLYNFSWWTIFKCIVWIILSYSIVNQYYILTELAVKVSEGKIVVID